MTGTSRIIHHRTKNDYLANRSKEKALTKTSESNVDSKHTNAVDKAELSTKSDASQKMEQFQGEKVLDNAKKVAQKVAKAPPVTPLVAKPNLASSNADKVLKASDPEIIDRPGIFFLGGLELFSIVSSDGISSMAEKIPSAENFSWSDENEVIEAIKKRPANQPIILIGHSLGGDSAVSIANELNSIEHGFRKVDLIVTLDSVGMNNDIIPENVKANLNFVGGSDSLLNDGANIARDNKYTQVVNELRSEGHREIDDSRNVQFKIFKAIENTLKKAEVNMQAERALKNLHQDQRDLQSSEKLPLRSDQLFDF